MKRILFIAALLVCAAFTTQAQAPSYTGNATPYTSTSRVLTNVVNDTLDAKVAGWKNSVGFEVSVVKNTGTVAGRVVFYTSNSAGTNYVATDSVTLADGPNLIQRTYTGNQFTNYRAVIKMTGTQNVTWQGWCNIR